jgi:hypothetical protein
MVKKPNQRAFKHPGGVACLPRLVLQSEEYRTLTHKARALLIEFQNIWTERRNGYLSISHRNAMRLLNCTSDTVTKAFEELERKRFLIRWDESSYQNRKAREYKISFQPFNGREPLHEWRTKTELKS